MASVVTQSQVCMHRHAALCEWKVHVNHDLEDQTCHKLPKGRTTIDIHSLLLSHVKSSSSGFFLKCPQQLPKRFRHCPAELSPKVMATFTLRIQSACAVRLTCGSFSTTARTRCPGGSNCILLRLNPGSWQVFHSKSRLHVLYADSCGCRLPRGNMHHTGKLNST
jgi:hypothetical protein